MNNIYWFILIIIFDIMLYACMFCLYTYMCYCDMFYIKEVWWPCVW
jgi:hypothetical protein